MASKNVWPSGMSEKTAVGDSPSWGGSGGASVATSAGSDSVAGASGADSGAESGEVSASLVVPSVVSLIAPMSALIFSPSAATGTERPTQSTKAKAKDVILFTVTFSFMMKCLPLGGPAPGGGLLPSPLGLRGFRQDEQSGAGYNNPTPHIQTHTSYAFPLIIGKKSRIIEVKVQ